MCELEGMSHLLRTYPEEFPNLPAGRLADKLAAQLQMSKSTIGEYRTIANNLGEKGMQAFQAGKLKKSAAVELATLPEEEQEELLKQGIVNHKEIKVYKKVRTFRNSEQWNFHSCSLKPNRNGKISYCNIQAGQL